MTIPYTILAITAVYFLLLLFFFVFQIVQPKYWHLWSVYYVLAVGMICYTATNFGMGAGIAFVPRATGIVLRLLVPDSQARESQPAQVDSASPSA